MKYKILHMPTKFFMVPLLLTLLLPHSPHLTVLGTLASLQFLGLPEFSATLGHLSDKIDGMKYGP